MGNPVVHWELMSRDPEKVSAFYEKLFGWKINVYGPMNYRIVETGGEPGINGGIAQLQCEEANAPPPGTLFYIAVDDLAAYRDRIKGAGGQIHIEEQEVPEMGWFCLFSDPEGRMMGLWKSRTPA
jgi:predicted enzyme related to lactoylglutathione lyase